MEKHHKAAAISLRIGLGLFLLIWGLAKFMQKEMWSQMYQVLYGFNTASLLSLFGIIQILLAVALLIGFKTKIASLLGGIMHISTTLVTFKMIMTPFQVPQGMPPNILLFAAVPILAAFIALYYLSE